jgi:(4S)-4-hydroxy-5-phosphonooxypentane-2,3-dione isomerase
MTGFVVTVDFKLKPGVMKRFRALLDRNAIDSCGQEPGCRRFDVMVPEGVSDCIFLYEIYDDGAAFDAHLKSAHFDIFNRESDDLVISRDVKFLSLVCEGSAEGQA